MYILILKIHKLRLKEVYGKPAIKQMVSSTSGIFYGF